MKVYFIGVDGEQAVNSEITKNQIKQVQQLECALIDPDSGGLLSWKDFNDENEPKTLFQAILKDRELRIDNHTLMADRHSFCIITANENKVVRLEYYEGHDALKLVYDIRSKELQGKELPIFLENDPNAYDPASFLAETFGIPEEVSKPILKKLHEEA